MRVSNMTRQGIDYSFSRPGGAAIAEAGYAFVLRYVPYPGGGGKGLTADEIVDLRSHGLDIGLVYESTAGRMFDGYPAGEYDAHRCLVAEAKLGLPPSMAYYFACDVDTQPAMLDLIDDYLRGCASVLGGERVGVYGEYDVVKHCSVARTATWFWQTYAWSGGRRFPANHLYQYLNGQTLNGGAVDYDEAYGDAGLWKAEEYMPTKEEWEDLKLRLFAGTERAGESREQRLAYADYQLAQEAQSVADVAGSAAANLKEHIDNHSSGIGMVPNHEHGGVKR